MAVVAGGDRLDMVLWLACGYGSIVTGCAVAGDIDMAHYRRCPSSNIVAGTALVIGANVVFRFAGDRRQLAVVAVFTAGGYIDMVESGRSPGSGDMAFSAIHRGAQMIACHAGCAQAIVTNLAGNSRHVVRETGGSPGNGHVALTTVCAFDLNMVRAEAGGSHPVVTVGARADNRGMVHADIEEG